jgi:hypothetical protein
VAPTDDVVEDKADNHPGHVVKGCRGRYEGRSGEDEREVDILEKIDLEFLVQNPLEQWCKGACQEEEDESVEKLTVREQTLWPNDTPLQHNSRR